MSVFIRKDSKDGIYSYDFQLGGRRFSGSTEQTTRRTAEAVERTKRAEAKALLSVEGALFAQELTILSATARYWLEVGQHHRNSDTTMWSLGWLKDHFGEATMLHDIDDSLVASMVAKRRGEYVPSHRKKGRKYKTPEIRKLVSPATVNRTVTQPLREIILRAAKVWNARTGKVDWSKHLLDEPQERVREATPNEESLVTGELDRGYETALRFAFLSGCRRMEIAPRSLGETEERYRGLTWTRVDFFSRQITIIGKQGKMRIIPMSQAIFDLLWVQQGYHPEYVFTFEAKRTVRRGGKVAFIKGQRYPTMASGLKVASRRAIAKSGVKNFRPHDTRHTAATRVLRKSNLRVVQNLLGHSDVKTTTKYAHAMMSDVLEALEAASPTKSPTEYRDQDIKRLKNIRKSE